ncbi:MAG: hypothetical protein ACREGF_00355 [Candidatus Saccharimonadales bacterium]
MMKTELFKPVNIAIIAVLAYVAVWGINRMVAKAGHPELEA